MTKTGIRALLIVIGMIILLSAIGFLAIKGGELKVRKVPLSVPSKVGQVSPRVQVSPTVVVVTGVASPTATVAPTKAFLSPTKGATPSARQVEVIITSFAFQPASITTGRGSTIVWTNQDTKTHTVTAADGSFDSGPIITGNSFRQRFDKIKSYTYSCSFQPTMKGTIVIQ